MRTTSSTSAAARTATSACARRTSSTASAPSLHAPPRAVRVILGVCGGYQLLGRSYTLGTEEIEGVGLLDVRTVREDGPRLIGNVAIEVSLEPGARRRAPVLAGFENHGGRTHLGASQAAARPGAEGTRQRRAQRL